MDRFQKVLTPRADLPNELLAGVLTCVSSDKAELAILMKCCRVLQEEGRSLLYREVHLKDEAAVMLLAQSFHVREENGALVRAIYFAADAEEYSDGMENTIDELLTCMTGLSWLRVWFDPLSSTALEYWSNRAAAFSVTIEVFRMSNSDAVSFKKHTYYAVVYSYVTQESSLMNEHLTGEEMLFWKAGDAWKDVAKFEHIKVLSVVTFIPMVDDDMDCDVIFSNLIAEGAPRGLEVLHIRHGVDHMYQSGLHPMKEPTTVYYDEEQVWHRGVTGTWMKREIYPGPMVASHIICGSDTDPFHDDVRPLVY